MFGVRSSVVRSAFLTLALTGLVGVASAFAADSHIGSVNFILGYKNLSGDWNLNPRETDANGQPLPGDRTFYPSLGLETTWGPSNWPVQLAFDVLNSADDGITHVPAFTTPAFDLRLRAQSLELGFGVRRAFNLPGITPYLGAGGLWSQGKFEIEVSDPNAGQFGEQTAHAHARSSAFGFWVGGGAYRRLGPRFQMGVAYRLSKATLPTEPFHVDGGTLPFGITTLPELDGGGRTIQLIVGWSFPSR